MTPDPSIHARQHEERDHGSSLVKLGDAISVNQPNLTEIQVASRVIQRTIGPAPWISLKFHIILLSIARLLQL